MINVKLGQIVFVNAKLHLRLGIANSLLNLMPSVVLELTVINL